MVIKADVYTSGTNLTREHAFAKGTAYVNRHSWEVK